MRQTPFLTGRQEAEQVYDALLHEALSSFKQSVATYDPYLDPLKNLADARRGATLIARLDNSVLQKYAAFKQDLTAGCPNQYLYPVSDLHVTIMSIVSCYSGYTFVEQQLDSYCSLIASALTNIRQFDVEFSGLTASNQCIMIKGFPICDMLNQLRNQLRSTFANQPIENTLDQRYTQKTAHITCVRFVQPMANFAALIELLRGHQQLSFGTSVIKEILLVSNDWYMQKANTHVLASFPLK